MSSNWRNWRNDPFLCHQLHEMEIRYWNLIKLEIGLDLKICEVVYSNLGDCRVCPIARHRSSWAGWSGHSRAGQATENCEQKVTNNMNPPVGKWNLNQSILSFCKIVRMLREKTQNRVCFSSWFASRVQKCGRWGWSQSDFVYSYQPFRQINIQEL